MIPLKPPTLEDIHKENVEYTEHIVRGGQPIQLVLELVPTQIGFNWNLIARIPNDLPLSKLPYIVMFTGYCRDEITKALQPYNEKLTDPKTPGK